MTVESEVQKWIGHLRRLKLPVTGMLLPGLPADYVRNKLVGLGLECPDELVELYESCGGVGASEGELLNHLWMYGSHYLLPFDEAVQNYQLFSKDERWSSAWFPFLGNDGGDFYSLSCLRSGNDWGRIIYFMSGSGDPPEVLFSSLLNMLHVINECFDTGVCFLDQEGNLDTNFFDASLIAMKHNRNLPYYG